MKAKHDSNVASAVSAYELKPLPHAPFETLNRYFQFEQQLNKELEEVEEKEQQERKHEVV